MEAKPSWEEFKKHYFFERALGFSLDLSRVPFPENFYDREAPRIRQALLALEALEQGALANADEKRMVGHYWLRNSSFAPEEEIKNEIEATKSSITEFAKQIHNAEIRPQSADKFRHCLLIGVGGSALGPQLLNDALGSKGDALSLHFIDNTDPDGMQRVLAGIPSLESTLVMVISKSGGTKETRNGMLVAQAAWQAAGLNFSKAAIAVTGEGSQLDQLALQNAWLARFPMWDWVGGRTSVWSAVGLLPAALQGLAIEDFLRGAAMMDALTRKVEVSENPALQLALAWYALGSGAGEKAMVVLPYRDRLLLLSRYLQQLVMESLGKEHNRKDEVVHQGLVVYGNKGSTDQHAFVQQLRDGQNNFFVVFCEILRDAVVKTSIGDSFSASTLDVENKITAGDYLAGFCHGTRRALHENSRSSIGVVFEEMNERTLGALLALFERAVGLYAELINVNAYHQPGVEAGKKAAAEVLALQQAILLHLGSKSEAQSVEQVVAALGADASCETVFRIMQRLAANDRLVTVKSDSLFERRYQLA